MGRPRPRRHGQYLALSTLDARCHAFVTLVGRACRQVLYAILHSVLILRYSRESTELALCRHDSLYWPRYRTQCLLAAKKKKLDVYSSKYYVP